MSDQANNITSALINTQVPEFVRNEHQTFVQFLEYYYKFLEQDGQQTYVAKNLLNFLDIDGINKDVQYDLILGDDHTSREEGDYHSFLQKMYDNFIKFIPDNVLADRVLILKHAKDFYRSRGSEKSIRFLMRALLDKEVSFYYPKQDVLKTSDGKWYVEKSLKVRDISVNNVSNSIAVSQFANHLIKGISSGATATVESVDVYFDKGQVVYELKLSGLYKEFQNAEKIFTFYTEEGNDRYLSANLFSGVITAVTINDGGTGYTEGSTIPITSNGTGASIVISRVSKGVIQGIGVVYGGAGFRISDSVVISGGGSGANANVSNVISSGYYHPNSYNVMWTTINLEANTAINNTKYSNLVSSITNPGNAWITNSMSYFAYSNCGPAVSCLVINTGNNYVAPISLSISANSLISRLGILGRMEIINGGTGYAANNKIDFINPIGSYGSGAFANVVSVNATGSITEVRFIAQRGEIIGGAGYDWLNLPKANVISGTGSGANITVTASIGHNESLVASNSSIGTIREISIISGGSGYIDNPVLNFDALSSGEGANATLTVVTGTYSYPGRYINDDGHISAYNFLEDRDYYQNYSYVVRVDDTINKYRKSIKDLIHPAGMKLFGEYLIVDDQDTQDNKNVTVEYANTVSNTKFLLSQYQVQDYATGVMAPTIVGANVNPEIINATYTVDNSNQIGQYVATGNEYTVYSPGHRYSRNDYVYFSIYEKAWANLVNGSYLVTFANSSYLKVTNPYTDSNTGNLRLHNPEVEVTLSRSGSQSIGDNVYLRFRTTDPFLSNGLYSIYDVSGSSRFKVLHPRPNAIIALVSPTAANTVISYFNRTESIEILTTGIRIVTPTLSANVSIPYSAGVLPDSTVNADILMYITESINVGPLWGGTVAASAAPGEEDILIGVGTYFNYFNIGDRVEISGTTAGSPEYKVVDIASNTIMLLSNALPNTISTSQIFKAYKVGDIVNLTGKGVANGEQRTVTATVANLTFNLKESFSQDVSANVTYKLASSNTSTSNNNLNSVLVSTNTTIVTANNHGFSEGDQVYILIRGGDTANITNGYYVVANVPNVAIPNTFNILSQKPLTTNGTAFVYTQNNTVVVTNHAASNGNTVYLTFSAGDQTNTTNGIYSALKTGANTFRIKTGRSPAANSNVRVYYSTNLYSNIYFTRNNHSFSTGNNVRIEFFSAGISNGIFTIKSAYSNTYNIFYNANTYYYSAEYLATENLLTNANNIAGSPWTSSTVTATANVAISPVGSNTAANLVATGADSYRYQTISGLVLNRAYTFSVWLKSPTSSNVAISLVARANSVAPYVADFVSPSLNVTNTWKKFSLNFVANTSSATLFIGAYGSFSTGESVLAWGAQANTSYNTTYYSGLGVTANIAMEGSALVALYK